MPAWARAPEPRRTVVAEVVALDQPFMWNRFGTANPTGMIFALRRDVVSADTPIDERDRDVSPAEPLPLEPGNVRLRAGKRPRPLVLRMNVGDVLEVRFQNLLDPVPPANAPAEALGVTAPSPQTRYAAFRVAGLDLVGDIGSDGSWVGANPGPSGSLCPPGERRTYRYYASAEGTFLASSLLISTSQQTAGVGGQIGSGLFGAVNVQPENAEWYRSQVTREDLHLSAYAADALPANMSLEPLPGDDRRFVLRTLDPGTGTASRAPVTVRDGRLYAWGDAPEVRGGHPIVDYRATYPAGHRRAGAPILAMLEARGDELHIVHSDLMAIITGPGAGRFPLEQDGPGFRQIPASPDRRQPYRELTVIYHMGNFVQLVNGSTFTQPVQPFEQFVDPALAEMLSPAVDLFAINYGMQGLATEALAARLGVGPSGAAESVDLKFEEFFLSAWAVGDPGMIVDVPANAPNAVVSSPSQGPALDTARFEAQFYDQEYLPLPSGPKATKVYYPDDPANVMHSYLRDHVKFRVLNVSSAITHIHHQHAHQWLHSPDDDAGHYRDSQTLAPGAAYTLEMVYGGSGNRNHTVGDAIFHCHFYPHFAAGMWSLWRVHDVFEAGTLLDGSGRPLWRDAAGERVANRALPDGEIPTGAPIPAVVPLPTLAMAPLPARVELVEGGRQARVVPERGADGAETLRNPGYPFFVPGRAGHRAPHPPLDYAWEEERPGVPRRDAAGRKVYLDGGLPRHLVLGGKIVRELHTRWDMSKDFVLYADDDSEAESGAARVVVGGGLIAVELPHEGSAVERVAMAAHANRAHPSFLPDGRPGNFITNGLPPQPGAPFADPAVSDFGTATGTLRRYKAAAIQTDVVFNKKGWHYPQQRFLTLWQDVEPTIGGIKAPEPLFMRVNSGEVVELWHTNLVPNYQALDDFQVRTPTDILGQHIHLVQFDVMASDGAGNGWNYEDGTFSPDEVRERIDAINFSGGILAWDEARQAPDGARRRTLTVKPYDRAVFGTPPAGQDWNGAQTTVQRWDADPLLDNQGEDRTLRSVFTHDHFGPSTHQQAGLYAALLVEPAGSRWLDPITGERLYDLATRSDGGPTSWQANVITADPADSFREFALEIADINLAYTADSITAPQVPTNAMFSTDEDLSAELPTGSGAVAVGEVTRAAFAAAGVTLSGAAVVALNDGSDSDSGSDDDSDGWTVLDPRPADQGFRYGIVASAGKGPGGGTTYQVTAPDIAPGWPDPISAVPGAQPKTAIATFAAPDLGNLQNGGPYPSLFIGSNEGTYVVNYRNEPIPYRLIARTAENGSGSSDNATAAADADDAADLAQVYRSIARQDPQLDRQPAGGEPIDARQPDGFRYPVEPLQPLGEDGVGPYDPYTPMLRAYQGDRIQVRTLVGAHFLPMSFRIRGVKWLFEPGSTSSGYRDAQEMSLSDHFELFFDLPRSGDRAADYLYQADASLAGQTNGAWGLMRAYPQQVAGLQPLPNNPVGSSSGIAIAPPADAAIRRYSVVATTALQALGACGLRLNDRPSPGTDSDSDGDSDGAEYLFDPYAILYFHAEDLDADGRFAGERVEPLILRARAGEWVEVTLSNLIDLTAGARAGEDGGACDAGGDGDSDSATQVATVFATTWPAVVPFDGKSGPPAVSLAPSANVGLSPARLGHDVTASAGMNVGANPVQTVPPIREAGAAPQSATYTWYAGELTVSAGGVLATRPLELGAVSLTAADPLLQHQFGMAAALIVEPADATWELDPGTRAQATVTHGDGESFRELVTVVHTALYQGTATAAAAADNIANMTVGGGVNLRTEPLGARYASGGDEPPPEGVAAFFSNQLVGGDPQTPVFSAVAGEPIRFRVLMPEGILDGTTLANALRGALTFQVHGHSWQEEPFDHDSSRLGHNPLSSTLGAQMIAPGRSLDLLIDTAGGAFAVAGDYLYHTQYADETLGIWGLLRVEEKPQ